MAENSQDVPAPKDNAPKNETPQKKDHRVSRRVFITLGVVVGVAAVGGGITAATYQMRDDSINGADAFDPPEATGPGEELPISCTIVYASKHAGNTLKLVRAIKERYPSVRTIDAVATPPDEIDLSGSDLVVLASGIYFGQFAPEALDAAARIDQGQKTLVLYTSGASSDKFVQKAYDALDAAGAQVVGTYSCIGAYRLLRFMPIMHEGHPTGDEINDAVKAFSRIATSL